MIIKYGLELWGIKITLYVYIIYRLSNNNLNLVSYLVRKKCKNYKSLLNVFKVKVKNSSTHVVTVAIFSHIIACILKIYNLSSAQDGIVAQSCVYLL